MRLGSTDIKRIGLGTNRLTHTPENGEFLARAVAAGINFIDTAHLYTRGESEATVGEAQIDGAIVATKGGYYDGEPTALDAEFDESLRRLRTDTIDLYYLHRVDAKVPLEHSVEAIDRQRERGRLRHVGLSEVGVEEIERARQVAPIAAVQNNYSLSERKYDEVVDYCEREQILFVPFYPLGGRSGLAGGVIEEIAASHGASPAQIALAWLLKRSPVVVPIPGTLSIEHLRENVAALEIELSDEEFDSLARM